LSETHSVDSDDSKKLTFTVTERNPRRGFSIKVRITLRAHKQNSCDATAVAEIRPVGKDMSNQAGVNKAFLLVMDEIRDRYGVEGSGLMAGFLSVVENMGGADEPKNSGGNSQPRMFPRTGPVSEEKKSGEPPVASRKEKPLQTSGLVSFEDMLKTGRHSPDRLSTKTFTVPQKVPESDPGRASMLKETSAFLAEEKEQALVSAQKDALLIEVKPLPKIRLSLMPSPREEDDESSAATPVKPIKKKKSSSSRSSNSKKSPSSSSSWRKPLRRTKR
jgi:hypothetical protein